MRKRTPLPSGFTLIESVIAVSVFVLAIFSILYAFPLQFRQTKTSQQESVAIEIAQAKIEEVISTAYEDLTEGIFQPRTPYASDPSNPMHLYETQVDVSYLDADMQQSALDSGVKKITVTVFYQEFGAENQINLASILNA